MPKNMSFLPEDYLEQRMARRTNIVCLVLFGVMMIGVVTTFTVTNRQLREVRRSRQQVNQRFEEAARRLEQLEQLQARRKQMVHKAKVTSVLVERVPRTLLLAEMINHMPLTLSLEGLELETKTVRTAPRPRTALDREQQRLDKQKSQEAQAEPLVELPQTQVRVGLIGVAPTDVEVAQFMTALSSHSLFKDVSLVYSEQVRLNEQEMRKFRIELEVRQDVDLQGIEPTRVARQLKQNPMGSTIYIDQAGVMASPGSGVMPATDRQE